MRFVLGKTLWFGQAFFIVIRTRVFLTLCLLDNFALFFSSVDYFFFRLTSSRNVSGLPSESQTLWIQIRFLSNLTGYVETFESLHIEIDMLTDIYMLIYDSFDEYQDLSLFNQRKDR